jgi:hypothetical protein
MKQKSLNREENFCKATRTMNKICIAGAILKVDVILLIGQLLYTGTVCCLLKSWNSKHLYVQYWYIEYIHCKPSWVLREAEHPASLNYKIKS